jgi:hypothetical protein
VTEKSEAIACARRCRSSQLTGWWNQKGIIGKRRAEEEESHKGLLTQKRKEKKKKDFDETVNKGFQKG